MVNSLLHHGPQEDSADHLLACFEIIAQHFADKVTRIHSDLDDVVNTGPVDVTVAPACPVLMGKFQVLQPDDLDRTLGEVKAILLPVLAYQYCQRWTG